HVRRWAVRLLGDRNRVSSKLEAPLAKLAAGEKDPEVRSQLASSAKRLPGKSALPIIAALWKHDEDVKDVHVPLLTWWALESKAESDRDAILKLFDDKQTWKRPLVEQFILERLMQRWAMGGGDKNLLACAALLAKAPDAKQRALLLTG